MLRARLATAAVAIPLLLALILYAPDWLFALVLSVLALIGVDEYLAMVFPARRLERVVYLLLAAALIAGVASQTPQLLGAGLATVVVAGLLWTLLTRADFESGLHDLGVSLIGILYAGFLLPHFIWLRGANDLGPRWVIFVLVIGMVGDTSGYAVGHAFGRHKLMPRVSPGKTIEGAVGIVLASLLAGAASKLIFLPQSSWRELLALAFAMAILGQLGDLSESIMKRTFGVKESGSLLPGHGGVLDRIDSLLFPVTFLYYYLIFSR